MSWECKYKVLEDCLRLKKSCKPTQTGCVLHGKVVLIPKDDFKMNNDNSLINKV